MPTVSKSLNIVHDLNNNEMYWRFIIAPWLGQFIQIMLDRWCMIGQAFNDYDILGTCILADDFDAILPKDMEDFRLMIEGDEWNHYIYAEIIKFRNLISPEKIDQKPHRLDRDKIRISKHNNNSTVKSFLRKVNYLLTKHNEFFFVDYSIYGKRQIILDLMLGQLTNIQPTPVLQSSCSNAAQDMRVNFLDEFETKNEFESFLQYIIPKSIPLIYLEGFKHLKSFVNASKCWPQKPKVIICSTAHNSNDFFKVWAAENRVQNQSKLVIAQHGGNYGLAKWNFFEDLELSVADYYFSWGWKKLGYNKIIPLPSLKIDRFREKLKPDNRGGVLILTGNLPRYSYFLNSLPIGPQVEDYFQDMFDLVSNFNETVFKKTMVRVYPYKDYEWNQKDRWLLLFPSIRFDDTTKTMHEAISGNRLAVGTYNSTTILEVLAANFPIVLYWNPAHSEINETRVAVFDGLLQAGVLHLDAKNAADFINDNWENIHDWWRSNKVQTAVENFCTVFAKTSKNAKGDWVENLKYIAKK